MHYDSQGDVRPVDLLAEDQIRVGDRTYTVVAQRPADGGWLLMVDGQRVRAYSASHNGEIYVWLEGRTYTLSQVDSRPSRRRSQTASGDLTAQMPGQVIDVLVAVGDAVEAGQTLVILEAMKMELRVTTPSAGVVRRLLVKTGDVVERGQALVEIADAKNTIQA
ncbi:MAG: biotin/lipoyl-binding protein [Anaerolineae bacterium]|nr:biotin/lipoyl-binding protein [Anaerolineae bacterium]